MLLDIFKKLSPKAYEKKEAIKVCSDNMEDVHKFILNSKCKGVKLCYLGDWLVRGEDGDIEVVKDLK